MSTKGDLRAWLQRQYEEWPNTIDIGPKRCSKVAMVALVSVMADHSGKSDGAIFDNDRQWATHDFLAGVLGLNRTTTGYMVKWLVGQGVLVELDHHGRHVKRAFSFWTSATLPQAAILDTTNAASGSNDASGIYSEPTNAASGTTNAASGESNAACGKTNAAWPNTNVPLIGKEIGEKGEIVLDRYKGSGEEVTEDLQGPICEMCNVPYILDIDGCWRQDCTCAPF